MPLRDHFRPPLAARSSWEGFHAMWPAVIVQRLVPQLPADFTAEPRVHLGTYFEVDVGTFDNEFSQQPSTPVPRDSGGIATATWAPPQPTLQVDSGLADQYEYEVLVYDRSRSRQLVAAVELISPANKDRPESRRALVTKCAALLQQGVCVSLVDLVTTRQFNLYGELLELLELSDPAFVPQPPPVYAVTCRGRKVGGVAKLESWAYPLSVGRPLPTLPLWLSEEAAVSLDLEASYEETCGVLRLT